SARSVASPSRPAPAWPRSPVRSGLSCDRRGGARRGDCVSRLLLQHLDWLVTMDPERRIFRDGAVAVEGDRIVAVGKTADVARGFGADLTLDGTGKLALPGLIDTHVHNTQQLGRGLADECDLPRHLLERLYGYERVMTSEDAHLAALACQL